ncbi:MAG TPA: trypsin-like peptidase domain-containing protein [Oceanobacillus sp.]|nr:trypsin-like peptidase domain-containing protein [Oceanobacillus sp.]
MSVLFEQLNDELAAIIATVQQSVVQVRDQSRGAGAGTIWHSDGLIVTNAHVVRRGPLQVALSDGRVLPATLLARDDEHDLAALSIEATDLPTIQPGNSRRLQAGQWVFAVGHPWGIANAATGGVVIGRGSRVPELPVATNDWVVADLHLRPGNSGGPLVDVSGKLVGVNTMMTGPGVGVAVAVDAVKEFLRRALGTPESIV